jgi:hypothetical protein
MRVAMTLISNDAMAQCNLEDADTYPEIDEDYEFLYPPEMLRLVRQCLDPEPDNRPT